GVPACLGACGKNPASEAELHRQLYLPHRRVIQQTRYHPGGSRADRRSGSRKLCAVDSVEHLDLELVLEPLPEARVLHDGEIGLHNSWSPQYIPPGIAVSSGVVRRRLEGRQVEPMIRRGIRQ